MARRTVAAIIEQQRQEPIYLTAGCCEAVDELLMPEVFKILQLEGSTLNAVCPQGVSEARADEFFPLTPAEECFIGEDWAEAPYGGAFVAHAMLYKGEKYLVPTVHICYDGPDRPFSIQSYGPGADAIYENKTAALREATALAEFLKSKVGPMAVQVFPCEEPDRHFVAIMLPAPFVVMKFVNDADKHAAFKRYVSGLFEGYTPTPSAINRELAAAHGPQ